MSSGQRRYHDSSKRVNVERRKRTSFEKAPAGLNLEGWRVPVALPPKAKKTLFREHIDTLLSFHNLQGA
jgi:hypothetical protein